MTDLETPRVPTRELVKEKSVTMEYFLETSHLDKQTAELLRQYDKDGDGSFSKDEVVAIILDLREAMQSNEVLYSSNKLFKRLLTAAVAFCVLLLTSMFGLSYAVAVLTAKTDVASDGSLVASGTGMIVATDSRANVVLVNSAENVPTCFSEEEKNEIMAEVFSGKNVLLQSNNFDASQSVMQLHADGADVVKNQPCFPVGDGDFVCFFANAECSRRRQLTDETTAPTTDSSADLCSGCNPFDGSCATCRDVSEGKGCTTGGCRRLVENVNLRERRERGY